MTIGLVTLEADDVAPMDLGLPNFPKIVERLVTDADAAMYRAREENIPAATAATIRWSEMLRP